MPSIQETVAHLPNGVYLSYFDTTAPEGISSYRTVGFCHGVAHNKRSPLRDALIRVCWEKVLKLTPPNIRAISSANADVKAPLLLTTTKPAVTSRHFGLRDALLSLGLFYFHDENPTYKSLIDMYISPWRSMMLL
jgi:hypothetical protein